MKAAAISGAWINWKKLNNRRPYGEVFSAV